MALPHLVQTLLSTLVFAAIFFFGARIRLPCEGRRYYRRAVSFSAGVALAYVFLDLLPEINASRKLLLKDIPEGTSVLADFWVYVAMLCGFLFFYGLHTVLAFSRESGQCEGDCHSTNWPYLLRICGFSLYVWLVTYLQVHSIEELRGPVIFYTIAMGMHLFLIEYALRREHGAVYAKAGKNILAIAAILGWAIGVLVVMPASVVITLTSIVAGGVIMNTMIMEMPREQESRFAYLLAGVLVYGVLILSVK